MRRPLLLFVFLLTVLVEGCDTNSNVIDPNNSFFLKYYGLDGDQTGSDLVVLPDGSFVLFGTTRATGKASNWYLVRVDMQGNILWEKTNLGGPLDDEASDIELTNNGNLVLVGNTYTSATNRDVLIMTVTFDGVKIDSVVTGFKNVAGTFTDEDALSVSLTSDGYIVAGSTSNTDLKPNPSAVLNDQRDAMHLRFFANLVQYPNSWGKTDGPGTYDVAVKVVEISSTQYYIFGYSNAPAPGHSPSNPDYNSWVFQLGPTGVGTNNFYIGDPNTDEKISSLTVAPVQSGDGYFLGGISYTNSGTTATADLYAVKLRKTLAFNTTDYQYQKPLSVNLGNDLPEATSVYASRQSGFYMLGNEKSFNDNQNWILTKLTSDGTIAWSHPIVFGGEGLDTIGALEELPDGRLLILGTMRTGKPDAGEFKMTLMKVSANGKFEN